MGEGGKGNRLWDGHRRGFSRDFKAGKGNPWWKASGGHGGRLKSPMRRGKAEQSKALDREQSRRLRGENPQFYLQDVVFRCQDAQSWSLFLFFFSTFSFLDPCVEPLPSTWKKKETLLVSLRGVGKHGRRSSDLRRRATQKVMI